MAIVLEPKHGAGVVGRWTDEKNVLQNAGQDWGREGERKERGRKEKNVHKDACSTCLCRITVVTTFNAYVDQVSLDLELATGLLVPRSCLVSNDDSFTRGTASLSCTMQEQMQFRLPPLPTGVRGRQRLGKRIEMDRKIACRRTTRVLYLDLVRLHKQSSIEWRSY